MPKPDLRTTPQAAEYLGKSSHTLALWRRQKGKGPEFIRVGGAVRYRVEALDVFLSASTVRPLNKAAAILGSDVAWVPSLIGAAA